MKEIARREDVCSSYFSRMVNLTLLAQDLIAVILNDAFPNQITLLEVAVDKPALWEGQPEFDIFSRKSLF